MSLGLPEIGTGSNYFSQYDSNITGLLSRIYDNNSNVILAKDVRDPIWSIWNQIQLVASQSLTASSFYSLGTPSTITIGGILEGSTFSSVTLNQLFDTMLLPYVSPVVDNFGPSITELQFGNTTPINLTYSINVGSVPLDGGYAIQFISPNPSSLISSNAVTGNDPETGTTNNFSLTYSTATISVVQYAVATMSFRTTDLTVFTATNSIAQKHKRYYGQITIPGGFTYSDPSSITTVAAYLTDTRIKGLSFSELGVNVNMSQLVEFNSQYFVFSSPRVWGFNYPVGFYMDNIFNQDFTRVRSNSNLTNEFGYVAPYDVYISNQPFYQPQLVSTINLPQGYVGSNFNNVVSPSVVMGDQGFQGPTGPQGFQGPTGPQGFQGPTGPQGFQGPTGPNAITLDVTPIISGTFGGILFESSSSKVTESSKLSYNNITNQFSFGTPSFYGSQSVTASFNISVDRSWGFRVGDSNGNSILSAFQSTPRNCSVIINESAFLSSVPSLRVNTLNSTFTVYGRNPTSSNYVMRIQDDSTNDIMGIRSDGRTLFGLNTVGTSYYDSIFKINDRRESTSVVIPPILKIVGFTYSNSYIICDNPTSTVFEVTGSGTTSVVDFKISNSLNVSSGLNKSVGTVSLVGGSVSVINSQVNTNSIILVTKQNSSSTDPISSVNQFGGSFSIFSSSLVDTSTVGYLIINPY
jgi:hypothetical protein